MFSKLSLKWKIHGSFLAVNLALFINGAIGVWTIREIGGDGEHIADVNLANAERLAEMSSSLLQMQNLTTQAALTSPTREGRRMLESELSNLAERYTQATKAYLEIPFVEGEQALYEEAEGAWKKHQQELKKTAEFYSAVISGQQDKERLSRFVDEEYLPVAKAQATALAALTKFQGEQGASWTARLKKTLSMSMIWTIAGFIANFLLTSILGQLISSRLTRQINDIAEKLESGANEVASASKQISESSAELSSSSTQQATSLQETVSSIDQVSAMVSRNAENAKRSQEVATTSRDTAILGKQSVESVIQAIEDINVSNQDIIRQIEASHQELAGIVKVISEIGNKTKVINDIVFQTKLLSFNASVEAARAGEHGKGFAVVAEEVGNLAQMSGNAAKEISQMLDSSVQTVEKIVLDTKTRVERLVMAGRSRVETGTVTARNCGTVLENIVKNVNEMAEMVGEIASASQEQSQGVQAITKTMGHLDEVTQQNASISEQSASAAEELSAQAETVRSMVHALMETVHGEGTGHNSGFGERRPYDTVESPIPAGPTPTAKVLPFRAPPREPLSREPRLSGSPGKKVVGLDDVPSADDSRFEDI
jgi:methyl-accepting chemotaxis protein